VSEDVLRWPAIGPFLRWRHARTALQILFLVAASALVLHGLFGPQIAPANLATVLTWVHYRGLLVVALLAVGNVFCTGCPFILVRDAGRRAHTPWLRWPRRFRTKWMGVVLFAGVLFAYELFDLWSLPRATAWLVLGYFGTAMAVDLVFSGASFCKYLCPIGQFNFVASTMSPLELQGRQPETCHSCRTADCIKGRRDETAPALVRQRGCELGLFLPAKVGNLDCTFCLDCVQACPHDNIALATRVPGLELVDSRRRSGIGRLVGRRDLAALVVVFVFGGLFNAFAMVSPVYAVEAWLSGVLGVAQEAPVLGLLFVGALVVAPLGLLGGASLLTPVLAGVPMRNAGRAAATFVYALVPLGFGVWLAHYGFHLLTGALTVIPVTQSAAMEVAGWPVLGAPLWGWTGMRPGSVYPIQVGLMLLGTMGSVGLAYLIAEREHVDRPVLAAAPWAAVTLVLAVAALWTLAQPMEMRAVGIGG